MTHTLPSPLIIEIPSQAMHLCAVRAFVGETCKRMKFDAMQTSQVVLAVDEALANVIRHGYDGRSDGRIRIEIELFERSMRGPGLRVVIDDWGKQVDPATIKSRDLSDVRPGGLGVHIIKRVMDEASYEQRDGQGMRLTLVKHVSSPAATGDGMPDVSRRTCCGEEKRGGCA
jgi:anti-sigma regulatory factor (Ser/Thr protein kinase)